MARITSKTAITAAALSANSFGVPSRRITCCCVSPCSRAESNASFRSRTTSFLALRSKDSSLSDIWQDALIRFKMMIYVI